MALGDRLGPLAAVIFDWNWGLHYEYAQAIRRYHAIVVGGFTTLPMLIVSKIWDIRSAPIMLIAVFFGTLYYLAPFVKFGEILSLNVILGLGLQLGPFAVGMFSAFGVVFVVVELSRTVSGKGDT